MISKAAPGLMLAGLMLATLFSASSLAATTAGAGLQGQSTPEPDCIEEECAVQDDGSLETGYGWVPSVLDGQYVQQIHSSQVPSRRLESVCVCWLRTRPDSDIDFEVVFYDSVLDNDGEPLPQRLPYASIPATAQGVPKGIVGQFYEIDVSGVELPIGLSYVGVRWDASVDQFFFVCADQTEETEPVEVFFMDEQSDGWGSAFDTTDPVFTFHRAMLVRVCSELPLPLEIPVLGGAGAVILGLLLAGTAVWRMRRRRF